MHSPLLRFVKDFELRQHIKLCADQGWFLNFNEPSGKPCATSTASSVSKEEPSENSSATITPNLKCIKRFEYDHLLKNDGINVKKESSLDFQSLSPFLDHGEHLFPGFGKTILFISMLSHCPFDRGKLGIKTCIRKNGAKMLMITSLTNSLPTRSKNAHDFLNDTKNCGSTFAPKEITASCNGLCVFQKDIESSSTRDNLCMEI